MNRRGRVALRSGALASILAAGACALAAAPATNAATSSDTQPPLRTPIASPRRAPALFAEPMRKSAEARSEARADAEFAFGLARIVAPYDACIAVDVGGHPAVRIGQRALAPASTLKLLTAIAELAQRGPEFHFTTRVVDDGRGNLIVIGGGDPLLASPSYITAQSARPLVRGVPYTELSSLADAIADAGYRRVKGALLVDDHLHDTQRFLPDWKPNYARDGEVGSLGALTSDRGFVDASHQTPVADPAIATGARLGALLAARGVVIAAGVRRGIAPAGVHEVAHVDSAPLRTIVAAMLTNSDNYAAEELERDLAASSNAGAAPASTAAAVRVEHRVLLSLGLAHADFDVHDGSGLAPDDRIDCDVLLRAIELSATPRFASIRAGLPVAGRTGTLATRFLGDPLAGHLHAKTGSIDGVVGLAGFIDTGVRPAFAFIANGRFSERAGQDLQAAVARAVTAYPAVRVPTGSIPRP